MTAPRLGGLTPTAAAAWGFALALGYVAACQGWLVGHYHVTRTEWGLILVGVALLAAWPLKRGLRWAAGVWAGESPRGRRQAAAAAAGGGAVVNRAAEYGLATAPDNLWIHDPSLQPLMGVVLTACQLAVFVLACGLALTGLPHGKRTVS